MPTKSKPVTGSALCVGGLQHNFVPIEWMETPIVVEMKKSPLDPQTIREHRMMVQVTRLYCPACLTMIVPEPQGEGEPNAAK